MKTKAICFLLIAILASAALSYSDSLRCKLVDWMDARSNHEFLHARSGGWPEAYDYTGCRWWDLDMGDSVLVWMTGALKAFFINPFNTTMIDTNGSFTSAGPDMQSCEMVDSLLFMAEASFYSSCSLQVDTIFQISTNHLPWASFSYLAHEDSFIYTHNYEHVTHDTVGYICINVADPENMFIYSWHFESFGECGLEALNGWAYRGDADAYAMPDYVYIEIDSSEGIWESSEEYVEVHFQVGKIDLRYPDSTHSGECFVEHDAFFGDIACDGKSRVYAVNSDLSPWPDWDIGESHLHVIETDTSYTFNQRWEGMAVFGVDVISESLVAAGFEHGFSIVNVADLDDIHEVAYYMNEDTTMDFTNFALKGNRLYAMGHWEDDSVWARLWMFELDDSVVMGLVDAEQEMPERLRLHSYPNPFNSAVTINLDCGSESAKPLSTIEIYNINGICVFEKNINEANEYFVWRPKKSLHSGTYFVRLSNGKDVLCGKLVYLK